jgi:hypothetical protein
MAITSKKINLSADFNDDKKKIIITSDNSTVTDEELESAIAAHVAEPTQDEIIQLNREQGVAKLKELGFTDEQISALLT